MIYLGSSFKPIADRKKRGEDKFEYLENKKSFLDEIKIFFHSYLRAVIWWKK